LSQGKSHKLGRSPTDCEAVIPSSPWSSGVVGWLT
jgi:hypothetical protein